MKKEAALSRLSALENEAKELRKIIESPEDSGKITDRVQTLDDIYKISKVDPNIFLPYKDPKNEFEEFINACAIMSLIADVYNEGWIPDWDNSNEYKYFPYFDMRSGSGFAFSVTHYVNWTTSTNGGSRHCFKSSKLAEDAGRKFLAVYKKFMKK